MGFGYMDFLLIYGPYYSNISVIWPSVLWTSAYTDHFSRNKRGPCIRNEPRPFKTSPDIWLLDGSGDLVNLLFYLYPMTRAATGDII